MGSLCAPPAGDSITARFARALRERRIAAGLAQLELAARSTVTASTISAIENGADCRLSTADALATALGTTVPDMLREVPR